MNLTLIAIINGIVYPKKISHQVGLQTTIFGETMHWSIRTTKIISVEEMSKSQYCEETCIMLPWIRVNFPYFKLNELCKFYSAQTPENKLLNEHLSWMHFLKQLLCIVCVDAPYGPTSLWGAAQHCCHFPSLSRDLAQCRRRRRSLQAMCGVWTANSNRGRGWRPLRMKAQQLWSVTAGGMEDGCGGELASLVKAVPPRTTRWEARWCWLKWIGESSLLRLGSRGRRREAAMVGRRQRRRRQVQSSSAAPVSGTTRKTPRWSTGATGGSI